jgi:hypothetical protein
MEKRPNPEMSSRDNPEWTTAMLAKACPAREVLPQIFGARIAATMLKPRGRPKSPESKVAISLSTVIRNCGNESDEPFGVRRLDAAFWRRDLSRHLQ